MATKSSERRKILARLDHYVQKGGPDPREYAEVNSCFIQLAHHNTGSSEISSVFRSTLSKIGCGPARGVYKYLTSNPNSALLIHWVDVDPKAIQYARSVCRSFSENGDRLEFESRNVLRFRASKTYDLLWSARLFEYFPDRLFIILLRRLITYVKPGGEVVIGNFGDNNPSRAYMELLGEWYLEHRSEERLTRLAEEAGVSTDAVKIDREPENVNLFLRIRR